ncbi:tRNA (32-2'-O)-methyltransferase regulator THADA-like [Antedon mediterranea]|uniref:tRNA (32-2'-O)-methyltransferase regulator THADA-like n=1 Tax=Antedon mediterranea TaxID=105859 RepID=UPI003AF7CEE5
MERYCGIITDLKEINESEHSSINLDLFKAFLLEENDLKQVSILKKFGSGLRKLVCPGFEKPHLEKLIGILSDIYVNTAARTILRRTIISVLQSLPDTMCGSIISALQTSLTNHIDCCDKCDQSSLRLRVDTIQSLMENFSHGEAAMKSAILPGNIYFISIHFCI